MNLDRVHQARARVREEGRVYFGQVFVVPPAATVAIDDIDRAAQRLYRLDWRIQDLGITPVPSLGVDSQKKGRQARTSP